MTNLVFLDTETTSLRPDRRAWEVAYALFRPGEPVIEASWFVDVEDLDLANADLMSLKIGRFYERHPQVGADGGDNVLDEKAVAAQVEAATRGAHIIGGVPNFDTEVLDKMLRRHGLCPAWHYHLVDFENLIVGYLRGTYAEDGPKGGVEGWPFFPPWKSDDLSRRIGVEPPSDEERHTALGDARWAARVWHRIMGSFYA